MPWWGWFLTALAAWVVLSTAAAVVIGKSIGAGGRRRSGGETSSPPGDNLPPVNPSDEPTDRDRGRKRLPDADLAGQIPTDETHRLNQCHDARCPYTGWHTR